MDLIRLGRFGVEWPCLLELYCFVKMCCFADGILLGKRYLRILFSNESRQEARGAVFQEEKNKKPFSTAERAEVNGCI